MSYKHTPLPWESHGKHISAGRLNVDEYPLADISSIIPDDEARGTADFIVRACNSYYDLVTAIKAARSRIIYCSCLVEDEYKLDNTEMLTIISEALSKAGAE